VEGLGVSDKQLKNARVRAAKAIAAEHGSGNEPALEAATSVVDALEHLMREVVKDMVRGEK
jgi:hypothetical protein